MQIENHICVRAPARAVFEFFAWLDHLRLVSPAGRREWCTEPGQRVAEGARREVCLEQGRHCVRLSFVTERLRPAESIVDVFSSWPLDGARRSLSFLPESEPGRAPSTRIVEVHTWRPPFFVRPLVDKRLEQQRSMFEERLQKAAEIIEQAYEAFGPECFDKGVVEPARSLGFDLDEPFSRRASSSGR